MLHRCDAMVATMAKPLRTMSIFNTILKARTGQEIRWMQLRLT
jgi:hypothetical protein